MNVQSFARLYTNFAVFIFLAFSVAFKGSYAASGVVILTSYIFLFLPSIRKRIALSLPEKGLVFVLLLYFSAILVEVVYYELPVRELDPVSKILLFIPFIYLLNAVKVCRFTLLFGLMAGCIGLFLLVGYEKFFLGPARVGVSINAIQLGNIALVMGMLTLLFLPISLSLTKYRLLISFLCIVCGLLAVTASMLTATRGGLIALPLLLLVFAYYYRDVLQRYLWHGVTLFAITIIAMMVFLPQSDLVDRFQLGINSVLNYYTHGDASTSAGVRLELWKAAWLISQDHWLLGVGLDQYMLQKQHLIDGGILDSSISIFGHSHNSYLYSLVRRGLLGVIILLMFIGFPVYIGYQQMRSKVMTAEMKACAMGLIIFGLFFFSANLTQSFFVHNSGVVIYTGLFTVLISLFAAEKQEEPLTESMQ